MAQLEFAYFRDGMYFLSDGSKRYQASLTPVRFTKTKAWQHVDGSWQRVHPAEVYHHAPVLSEAEFTRMFPDLPPLPVDTSAD